MCMCGDSPGGMDSPVLLLHRDTRAVLAKPTCASHPNRCMAHALGSRQLALQWSTAWSNSPRHVSPCKRHVLYADSDQHPAAAHHRQPPHLLGGHKLTYTLHSACSAAAACIPALVCSTANVSIGCAMCGHNLKPPMAATASKCMASAPPMCCHAS